MTWPCRPLTAKDSVFAHGDDCMSTPHESSTRINVSRHHHEHAHDKRTHPAERNGTGANACGACPIVRAKVGIVQGGISFGRKCRAEKESRRIRNDTGLQQHMKRADAEHGPAYLCGRNSCSFEVDRSCARRRLLAVGCCASRCKGVRNPASNFKNVFAPTFTLHSTLHSPATTDTPHRRSVSPSHPPVP